MIGLTVAPTLAGIALGARTRTPTERRLGTMDVVVDVLVAVDVAVSSVGGLVFG